MGIHWSFQKSGVKIKMMFTEADTEAINLVSSGEIQKVETADWETQMISKVS